MGIGSSLKNFIQTLTNLRRQDASSRRDLILESYLPQLRSEFDSLDPTLANSSNGRESAAYARLKQYIDLYTPSDTPGVAATKDIEWWMAYKIERALVQIQPEAVLRAKVWSVEEEFVYFAGQDRFDRLKNSFAKAAGEMVVDDLRNYLDALLREIHWLDTVRPAPYRKRKELLRTVGSVLIGLLVSLFSLLVVAWASWTSIDWPWFFVWLSSISVSPLFFVVLAGAIGSLVSFTQRIQTAPAYLNPLADLYELSRQKAMLPLLVASGILGALVLYVSVCGKLISGTLFPEITSSENGASSLETFAFLRETGPTSGVEFAKLLLWSFVAGFSERFIPNTLQRFIGKLDSPSGP